jgi:plastocyanin
MMKRILTGVALVSLLGAGYALAAGSTVTLTADGPQPPLATVAWGDTVTFSNADSKNHQVTIPRVALESPQIPAGGAFEYVFDGRRGTYGYRQTGGGPNKLGTIVVNLNGTVTLKAAPIVLLWGKTLRLTGVSSFAGTPVNISERVPGGGADWAKVATVTAAADGAFSFELKPQRGARYRAGVAADQVFSAPVLISVKPIVTMRALARKAKIGRPVTITARITPAKAAVMLDLERFDPRHRRWLSDQRRKVSSSGRATFRWPARKGASKLRVAIRPLGLNVGWAEAASTVVTVTGV